MILWLGNRSEIRYRIFQLSSVRRRRVSQRPPSPRSLHALFPQPLVWKRLFRQPRIWQPPSQQSLSLLGLVVPVLSRVERSRPTLRPRLTELAAQPAAPRLQPKGFVLPAVQPVLPPSGQPRPRYLGLNTEVNMVDMDFTCSTVYEIVWQVHPFNAAFEPQTRVPRGISRLVLGCINTHYIPREPSRS